MQRQYRTTQSLFEGHPAKAQTHVNNEEFTLAMREYKEAARLRPRDRSVRSAIERLGEAFNSAELESRAISSERIRSLFNLTVRYWDNNMPSAALKEVTILFSHVPLIYVVLEGLRDF